MPRRVAHALEVLSASVSGRARDGDGRSASGNRGCPVPVLVSIAEVEAGVDPEIEPPADVEVANKVELPAKVEKPELEPPPDPPIIPSHRLTLLQSVVLDQALIGCPLRLPTGGSG